jgi:hypothetical protein
LLERYPEGQPLPFRTCPLCDKENVDALLQEFDGQSKPPPDGRARYLVADPLEVFSRE